MRKFLTALGLAVIAAGTAFAQEDWPSKPVTIVIPSPPGGSSDMTVRAFSEPLSRKLDRQFVVDSVPGGAVTSPT